MVNFKKYKQNYNILTYIFLLFTLFSPGLFYFYFEAYRDFLMLSTSKVLLVSALYGLPLLILAVFKCTFNFLLFAHKSYEDTELEDNKNKSMMEILFHSTLESTLGILLSVVIYFFIKFFFFPNPIGGIRFIIYFVVITFFLFNLINSHSEHIKRLNSITQTKKWWIILAIIFFIICFNLYWAYNSFNNSIISCFSIGFIIITLQIFFFLNCKECIFKKLKRNFIDN